MLLAFKAVAMFVAAAILFDPVLPAEASNVGELVSVVVVVVVSVSVTVVPSVVVITIVLPCRTSVSVTVSVATAYPVSVLVAANLLLAFKAVTMFAAAPSFFDVLLPVEASNVGELVSVVVVVVVSVSVTVVLSAVVMIIVLPCRVSVSVTISVATAAALLPEIYESVELELAESAY